jgi:hypothetical protein
MLVRSLRMRRTVGFMAMMALAGTTLPAVVSQANDGAEVAVLVLRVSGDRRSVEVKRTMDSDIRHFDVLAKCGVPAVGEPMIRDLNLSGSVVHVTYGKHCFADLALRELALRCVGCD